MDRRVPKRDKDSVLAMMRDLIAITPEWVPPTYSELAKDTAVAVAKDGIKIAAKAAVGA